jgi:hypothetical protein
MLRSTEGVKRRVMQQTARQNLRRANLRARCGLAEDFQVRPDYARELPDARRVVHRQVRLSVEDNRPMHVFRSNLTQNAHRVFLQPRMCDY